MRSVPARKIRMAATAVVVALLGVSSLSSQAAAAGISETPDETWQTNGRVRTIVYAGSSVFLGGDFTQVRDSGGGPPVNRSYAAAFDAVTGSVLPWDPDPNNKVWALEASPDGSTIYMGGDFTTVAGESRSRLAAVDAVGGIPTPWNPTVGGKVQAILVSPEGSTVYIGGYFTKVNGVARNRVAALLTATPTLVDTFKPSFKQVSGTCPPVCTPMVASLAFSADATGLYVGGHFSLANDVSRKNGAEVSLADGSLLPWDPSPYGGKSGGKLYCIAVGSSKVYITGDWWSIRGVRSPNMGAVDPITGLKDTSFVASTDGGSPACALSDSLFYVGGHFTLAGGDWAKYTGASRDKLVAFDADTGEVDPWDPGANSVLGVHAMALGVGHLAAGGDFTIIGGRSQQGFAQFSGAP